MDPLHATEALLAVIEEDRMRRCEAIEAEARRTASQLLGVARSAARLRVREALAIERLHSTKCGGNGFRAAEQRCATAQAGLTDECKPHREPLVSSVLGQLLHQVVDHLCLFFLALSVI